MKGAGLKLSPGVLKKLILLGEKQGKISLKDLSLEIGLSSEDTLVFIRQIFPNGVGAHVYNEKNECMIDIDANALQYMLPLTPPEWIGLHYLLTQLSPGQVLKNPALETLKNKMTENGPIKAVMELLSLLDQWETLLSHEQQSLVAKLEDAATKKALVQINTTLNKQYNIFPCRVIHLEGKLSLIGEDETDHCMIVLTVNEVKSVLPLDSNLTSNVSNYEIEEFITAIRSMNEKETRLILKIHDPQSVNLFPDHHFLGKPCMVTNPNGDLIWAAYVEPCEDLFEWLLKLGKNVEILDPGKFKDEFLTYCEEKLSNIA